MNATINVIDTVKKPGYAQWIEGFVRNVMNKSGVEAKEVLIIDIHKKTICLSVGGYDFRIFVKSVVPVARDERGMVCSEDVECYLYAHREDSYAPIMNDMICHVKQTVKWSNDPKVIHEEVADYIANTSVEGKRTCSVESGHIILWLNDLIANGFCMPVDVQHLNQEEIDLVLWYLLSGRSADECMDRKVVQIVGEVHKSATNLMADLSFVDGVYDNEYFIELSKAAVQLGYCSSDTCFLLSCQLSALSDKAKKGDKYAMDDIQKILRVFILDEKPYSICVA